MLRRVVLVFAVAAASLAARPAAGQRAAPAVASPKAPADSAAHWLDSLFAPFARGRSPGCAVGVSRDGELTFAKGYGFADLNRDTPITPDTRFYLASLSKQFTAMSIVLLARDGRLSLDDSIRKWVPEVPWFGKPITLRELLHHTSGLRDYYTLLAIAGWQSGDALTERQFLDLIERQKSLNFAPGDEFLYSNTGYALLSIVVRRASGESLRDFARQRIFEPLGMTHTEFRDDHRTVIPNAAIGYELTADGFRESEPELDVVGDGGAYSTIGDLAKWDANFTTHKVGGADGIAEMEQPGTLNNGQTVPYGLALSIAKTHGMTTYSHSGAYGGFRTAMVRYPDQGLSIFTLCNTSSAPASLADEVAALMLGQLPSTRAATTLDLTPSAPFSIGRARVLNDSIEARQRNDRLLQLAGRYYSDELDLPVQLVARDGALVLERPHSPDIRFAAIGDDLFASSDQILLRVVRDGGTVKAFTLTISRARDIAFQRQSSDTPAAVSPARLTGRAASHGGSASP